MGSSPWWLPWAMYTPMGAVGLAWALTARGQVLSAPGAPWLSSDAQLALALGLLLAAVIGLTTVWLTRLLVARTQWARALHLLLRAPLRDATTARLITLAALSALGEELFFRAALQPAVGLGLASIAFGLAHVSPRGTGVAWTLWASVMGVVFGALFEASGSLLVPIAAHALINYGNMQYIRSYDPTLLDTPRRRPHMPRSETRIS